MSNFDFPGGVMGVQPPAYESLAAWGIQGLPDALGTPEPCVLLDDSGYIVAANFAATRLMDRRAGDYFGIWGPGVDHAELDLILIRQGATQTTRVRARRLPSDAQTPMTRIVFEPLADQPITHSEGIGLAAVELIQAHPDLNLSVSLSEMPEGRCIQGDLSGILSAWLQFFRNTANWDGDSPLQIRANQNQVEDNFLNLELYLCFAGLFLSDDSQDHDLSAAAQALTAAGGTFQLTVDYPELLARLRLPLV